ncbi:MAG: efflux RND transporter periplasmic adaptor subunit [Pseudomonadota bacterium]
MKKKNIVLIILVATAGMAIAVFSAIGLSSGKSKPGYSTAKVVRRDLGATVQATGIVKPMIGAEVKVGSRTPGKVVELPINVGQKVAADQVIARLEQEDLKAKVKFQQALLAEAVAELERADRDHEREKPLWEKGTVSKQQFDKTVSLLGMARARADKFRAELDYQRALLSYATITAPIKGTVASVTTIQGETVTTGLNAPTFIKIIDLDRLEVLAYVDENDIGKVRVGQEAIFSVAAHSGVDFKGVVTSIYPSATIQDNVVYYITTISVDNREGKLMPDMTSNVLIFLDRRKGVLTVPNKAVQREGQTKYVHVVEENGPRRRDVQTGWKDAAYTEIFDGLRDGESIVLGELPRK